MKPYLFLLSLLVSIASTLAHANSADLKTNIKFGVSGGVGAAFCKIEHHIPSQPYSPLLMASYHIQVFGDYTLTKYVDLHCTLGYHPHKGYILKYTQVYSDLKTKLNFDYVQFTTQCHIFPADDRRFFIFGGGYAAYLLSAKLKVIQSEGNHTIVDLKNPKQLHLQKLVKCLNLGAIDLGVVLGIGYEYKIGLHVKLGYEIGLKNIIDDHTCKLLNYTVTNLGINLTIGYNFARLFVT